MQQSQSMVTFRDIDNIPKVPYGYIYVITNNINYKRYIGQTIVGFDKRYSNNLEKHTHNTRLKNSIQKYGIENFTIDKEYYIAYNENELNELEQYYIHIHGGIESENVYNMIEGGFSGRPNEETKKLISQNKFGHTVSQETRDKISESLRGNKRLEESIQKQRISTYKKVICINTGTIYNSITEASFFTKADASDITRCCKGKVYSAGKDLLGNKLIWEYYIGKEEIICH